MIAMLFLIPTVFAAGTTRYPSPGGINQDYVNDGRSTYVVINNEFQTDIFSSNLASSHATPIIDDFDNDGVSEMFILDGDVGRIYQNKELDVIATLDENISV